MKKINYFLTDERNRKVLKAAGAVLALMGLTLGGVAADPIVWPG